MKHQLISGSLEAIKPAVAQAAISVSLRVRSNPHPRRTHFPIRVPPSLWHATLEALRAFEAGSLQSFTLRIRGALRATIPARSRSLPLSTDLGPGASPILKAGYLDGEASNGATLTQWESAEQSALESLALYWRVKNFLRPATHHHLFGDRRLARPASACNLLQSEFEFRVSPRDRDVVRGPATIPRSGRSGWACAVAFSATCVRAGEPFRLDSRSPTIGIRRTGRATSARAEAEPDCRTVRLERQVGAVVDGFQSRGREVSFACR